MTCSHKFTFFQWSPSRLYFFSFEPIFNARCQVRTSWFDKHNHTDRQLGNIGFDWRLVDLFKDIYEYNPGQKLTGRTLNNSRSIKFRVLVISCVEEYSWKKLTRLPALRDNCRIWNPSRINADLDILSCHFIIQPSRCFLMKDK